MLVTVIADGIAILLMPKASIMTEKLVRRGLRIHQDYEADVLQQMVVSETMDREAPIFRQDAGPRTGRTHRPSRTGRKPPSGDAAYGRGRQISRNHHPRRCLALA